MNKTRMKKTVSLLLAMLLVIGMFAGCSNSDNSSEASKAESKPESVAGSSEESKADDTGNTDEEPYNIVFAFLGSEQEDQQMVWDAINELTLKELNMTFEPLLLSWGDYSTTLNLMLSGGDELDVLPVFAQLATSYISASQIVDLGDYIYDHGQGIIDNMGEDLATAGRSASGFIYGIPSNKESATRSGITMRKDIVDELGIDVEAIKKYDDLDAVFEKVKAAYPEMDAITGRNFTERDENYDNLFDMFGVLSPIEEGNTTVTNWFESDAFKTRVERSRRWYEKGYVRLDAATSTEAASALVRAGTLFSYLSTIKPGFLVQENAACGMEMVTAYIDGDDGEISNYMTTNNVNFFNWGIANNSEDKVKAMEFLNFAYTSREFNDLLNFGIEGVHYEKVDGSDLIIDFPEGVDATNNTYHLNLGWHLPNQFVGSIWNGLPEDIWQQYKDFNASATYSPAFGFMYDSSEVINEVTALASVKDEFYNALVTGSVSNVEQTLEDFNNKLYAAGLQKVIDAKQRQLDEWLAEQ